MNQSIATWVKSLGDFPLDPDHGKAWLWSGDGARLIWQSAEAAGALGFNATSQDLSAISHAGALESFATELTGLQPDRQPIRVKQLPLNIGRTSDVFTCLCRHVPLADGSGFGLLTVAIGAQPRLSRQDATASQPVAAQAVVPQPAAAAPAPPPPAVAAPAEAAAQEEPATVAPSIIASPPLPEKRPIDLRTGAQEPRSTPAAVPADTPAAPAWRTTPPGQRRSLRFVWQTDAEGRFAHVSRELGEAVGPASAMILGKRFGDLAQDLRMAEAADAVEKFAGTATWTATPFLWPVTGGGAVPVELAGMPVRENGVFAGFRGYGIARIEGAVDRAEPLHADEAPHDAGQPEPEETETPEVAPSADEAEATAPVLTTPPESVPASPDLSSDAASAEASLTSSERNAFREIARALGRRQDNSQDNSRDTSREGTREPDKRPATPDRPPTSPHQMPEWIARRQLARASDPVGPPPTEAPATTPVPESDNSAVVPFEALQTRWDRRVRDTSSAQLASVLDRLPLAMLVMQKGQPVHANPAFLHFSGHADLASFNAAGGADDFFARMPPELAERESSTIMVRRADGVTVSSEAEVIAISWDDTPATLTSFRPSQPATPARPEADLQTAQAELRELRFVLDTAMDGVLSLDGHGRILAVNRSAEALFGFDQKEIIGEPLTILLEPESHDAALDYLQGLKADGVATIMNDGRDVVGRERHGGRIPLFMTLGRLSNTGEEARYCAVLRDVTIWKKAEEDLTSARRAAEDANANKSEFLARISHEIRTPMNAIIGFADVMRSETFGPLGNERYKGYANDIHTSGNHVVSLVNDLLDLSKIAAGKLDLTFGSVDLNQVVAESVNMIQPQANASSVIVRTQLAQRMPPIVADQRSIRQIMLNLLSNAAKFTEPGGQVVVSTVLTEAGEAAIRVRDTGIGMNPDEVRKALEPFRQIPGPKSQGGTGLGLPLTKALAEANRAAFAISSEPGKGTLAEVVFPATRVLAE